MLQSDCAQELRTLRRGGPSAVTVKGRPKNKGGEGIEGGGYICSLVSFRLESNQGQQE